MHLPAMAKLTVSMFTLSVPELARGTEGGDVRHIPARWVVSLSKLCYFNPKLK